MKKQMPGVDSQQERLTFGRNFRRARLVLRLRQRDVHLLTGIAQSHISELEEGSCNISIDTMVKLATVVKVPLWRLFKPAEAGEEEAEPEEEKRREPRDKEWYDENLQAQLFNFSTAEMRQLRQAAVDEGVTVPELLRRSLRESGFLTSATPQEARRGRQKKARTA
jgi:transcriptional regulator with XRE-family HTH domain